MSSTSTAPFRFETDLVNGFVEFLSTNPKRNYQIHHEFEGGFGRPDLLLCSNPSTESERDVISLGKINPRLAPLLSKRVANSIHTHASLAKACGTSIASAQIIARELNNASRLKFTTADRKRFQIEPVNRPPFEHVVAIEAKLRDWRRALTQAYRYTSFSNEAWVLLDDACIGSAHRNAQWFKKIGIGLASFSRLGELRIYVKAKRKNGNPSGILAWRTQAILARANQPLKLVNSFQPML